MKTHVFIVNPTSGVGKYELVIKWIKEYFQGKRDSYEIHLTEYEGHAQALAKRYEKNTILYAVGGDGTAHEVLNGLYPDVEMAVIPVGTGNDFWKMIQFEGDLKEILISTIEGEVQSINIGLANGHRFLNCANIGLDAEVNKLVNNIRHPLFPRKIIYLYAAILELVRYKPTNIEVYRNGKLSRHSVILTAIMNGKWYGGGFKSAPKASLTDDKLDLCLVETMPLRKIFPLIKKYYNGKHLGLSVVHYEQVDKVVIKSDREIPLGCDGEVFDYHTIQLSIDPAPLLLRLPKKAVLKD